MKTTTLNALLLVAVLGAAGLAGCAGPAVRHEARMDRRSDAGERVEDRSSTRQYNRYDRRTDRYDRIDSRYGY